MANEFWFNDQQWANIEPLLPKNRPGARRVDDRRVLSGIVHILKRGCRWRDCPTGAGRCRASGDGCLHNSPKSLLATPK